MAAILLGTLLLALPFSTRSGSISFIDALFTSTSAVCVTGLIVKDTPQFFSTGGQVIIITLIQLGGLGIMTFSTLILLVAGRKIAIKDRILIQEGFSLKTPSNFKSLILSIFFYALTIEFIGVLLLFMRFQKDFIPGKALYLSLFHSISAFCNAGFSLFSNSLCSYRGSIWINAVFMFLIIFGGLGFLVIHEVVGAVRNVIRRRKTRISLHTKVVFSLTSALIFFPFLLVFFSERGRALASLTEKERILSSLFQVVTARTAGFNTIDLASLGIYSVFLILLLMFIGASSGSTGGGVKTSTIGVILAFLRSKIYARETVHVYCRTISMETVIRAYTLISLALILVFCSALVIFLNQPELSMREVLFEVFSAFGTVGLSLGTTMKLTTLSKAMIILTMYIGRISPLVFLYAFSRTRAFGRFQYIEESIMIG